MKKSIGIIIAVVIAVSIGAVLYRNRSQDSKTIRIGALLSLTGGGSAWGENADLLNLYEAKYGKKPGSIIYVAAGFDTAKKIGKYLPSQNMKETFDKIFGPTRSADRIEKLYQVKKGVPAEVR